MNIFAISDLHLPGDTGKSMDRFGPAWQDHAARIAAAWDEMVGAADLVLMPGDFSWAMRLEGVRADFAWLAARPGMKIMIRGNHDYWWSSVAKARAAAPAGVHLIQNDAIVINDIALAGARYWADEAVCWPVSAGSIEDMDQRSARDTGEDRRLRERELQRLELSLHAMQRLSARQRIALLHFPPIGADGTRSAAAELLEQYRIDVCVFGHIHGSGPACAKDGEITAGGVRYVLVAADATAGRPKLISKHPDPGGTDKPVPGA